MKNSNGDGSGESFGPYQVYERLGVGGMASVHRAVKQGIEDFERTVALKRLLSHLAEDESFVKSFVREARLASKLQHANIIQLYDLGRVGRVYYIAMEYVRGRDLRKVLKQTAYATGPMPVAMMLSLTQQLCDALDYAHTLQDDQGEPLGLVHRDISPSNLLIAADGHLKVIDFGIAKATAASLRTSSGRVKGKFAYMAPEAIKGRTLDHRSDIFSAGIVAHEMLTARPLFASKNEYDTLQKISHEPVPPPSHLNPDCPPELDEIVLTALAKSPDERWQSAGAMHRALDHVVKKHSLRASRREIAEWIKWAFEQPLQRRRVKHKRLRDRIKKRFKTNDDVTNKNNKPTLRSSTGPIDVGATEKAKIEIVWGSNSGATQPEANPAALPHLLAYQRDMAARSPQGATPSSAPNTAQPSTSPGVTPASRMDSAGPATTPNPGTPSAEPASPVPTPQQGDASAPSNLPAWARGTPQTQPGVPVTSSFRVTMLGMAPPRELKELRELRAESIAAAQQTSARDSTDSGTDNPGASQEVTNELSASESLSHSEDDTLETKETLRRNRPGSLPAPVIEAAIEAAIEPSTEPSRPISVPQQRHPSGPVSGPIPNHISGPIPGHISSAPSSPVSGSGPIAAHSYPEASRARPYNPDSELSDLEIPRSPVYRAIQIGILTVICVIAAVVGYMLMSGNLFGSDSTDSSGQNNDTVETPASSDTADSPAGAAANPETDRPPPTVIPDAGARKIELILRQDAPPLVSSKYVERISGKLPRGRAGEVIDERGEPVTMRANLCIDDAGKVTDVKIIDAPKALIKRTQKVLKRWAYEPFEHKGQAIAVCFDIELQPQTS